MVLTYAFRPSSRLTVRALLLASLIILVCAAPAGAQQRLDILARVGPWPVASNLIVYRGRLWFSNSVKGRNHNSADIWSLDPKTGQIRYERHLFSQDVGRPLLFHGLLYWPHEDPRVSLGYGAASVTDGNQWSELSIRTAQMFHVHDLIDWDGSLVAVTSAWRAGLQVSDDGGASWSHFYEHPTPPNRVSRLQSAAVLRGRLYFRLRDPAGTRLVAFRDGHPVTIENWPKHYFHSLTAHRGALYGIVGRQASATLWRKEGRRVEQLSELPGKGRPVALHAGSDRLWVLFVEHSGGYVASTGDGTAWRTDAVLEGGQPIDLISAGRQILVGGTGPDERAIIWGRKGVPLPEALSFQDRSLPEPLTVAPLGVIDWRQQAMKLKAALQDSANFDNHGRDGLREIVQNIVALSPPASFLSDHLFAPMSRKKVTIFGRESEVPARQVGQWILLWGMASNRKSRVPVDFLKRPWLIEASQSEKYFDPLLGALFTVSRNRQRDHETVSALISRLESGRDPLWLTGDIIGTLSAITDKKFAYDTASWTKWWHHQHVD